MNVLHTTRFVLFGTLLFAMAGLLNADEEAPAAATQMSESLRSSIAKVIVVPGQSPVEKEVSGTYEDVTPGLYGGMAQGGALGSPSIELGGVTVSTPIPILTLPGMIVGGLSGAAKRERQEFHDALTEELADAVHRPLTNEKLARYVFQNLRSQPQLDATLIASATSIPDDTDAVLYVRIANIGIDVDGDKGVLTTSAYLTLERLSDGTKLYERNIHYQDRAPLKAWTTNDRQLFDDFTNFALYYLGRELAVESLTGISREAVLQPLASDSVKLARKNPWNGNSKSTLPTLAWNIEPGDANLQYDLEVFDAHRLVYAQSGVRGTTHTLGTALTPCGDYRWSVRPTYSINGSRRYGEWMQQPSESARPADAMIGRDATVAPAYTQDFAVLNIHCRAK